MARMATILLLITATSWASLDDFVELDAASTRELNEEIGIDADSYYAHVDFAKNDSAPIISFKLYGDDDSEDVGSYDELRDELRGMSEIERLLSLQPWIASSMNADGTSYRISEADFLEDAPALFIRGHYLEPTGFLAEQFQVHQWSDDDSRKCLMQTEIEIRLSEYYSDAILDALAEMIVLCAIGLNENP